jgi:hypothetical protein
MIPFFRLSLLNIVITLSGLLTSCEFQPHEIPDSGIEKPSDTGPPIVFNLNDYHDTIKIGYITNFNYTISGTYNKILAVEISIGGTVIHEYIAENQQAFSFTFDPVTFPDGDYHMNATIITSTGSGSIAEKLGVEGYLYELDLPVIIDKAIPEGSYNIAFEKVHNPEGLKLSWLEFNHANCIKYVIYRQYRPIQQEPVLIAEITDPEQSYYIDHSFWEGQEGLYFVRIITPYGHYDGNFSTFRDELIGVLSADWHNDGTLDVRWNKAQNLETFDSYYVFTSFADTPMESYLIGDPDETHVIFRDAGFAYGINIFLAIVPNGLDVTDYKNLRLSKYTNYTPAQIPLYFVSCIVNNHEFILLSQPGMIYRYYPDEQRTDDSLAVSLTNYDLISVSNNGNRFAYFQGSDFYIRRTDDFTTETVFSDPSIPYPESVSCLSISDNNRLLVTDTWNHIYLYNSATGELIRKDSMPLVGLHKNTALISPDGTKMIAVTGEYTVNVSFFSLEPSGWTEIGKIPVTPHNMFYSKDGIFVFLVTSDRLIKCRTSDFGIVSDYSFPEGYFSTVDLDRGRLLCSFVYGPEFNIVELNSGQVLKTLNIGVGTFTIFKNHIITSGRQLDLQQF